MTKKELRNMIKEEIAETIHTPRTDVYFNSIIKFLTGTIYPKLNPEEKAQLNLKFLEWFKKV